MEGEPISLDKAEELVALHGAGAIGVLVDRIADAVRHCDDQTVDQLDRLLQSVEQMLEEPWWRNRSGITPTR